MFYSHNLLARKGPLGTVWYAAHLQKKLNKQIYISVNITSTVEQIMNPAVPIALRMSGHLLFGVVRIYSKKVEYFHQDCNNLRTLISKAYANADINLPEDANHAKYDSITLPDNFALDLIDIDASKLLESPDSHLRCNEDISFEDHSPASFSRSRQGTPAGYIMISLGEDASQNPSTSGGSPGPRLMHVEENSDPHTLPTINGVQDPDPNHDLGSNDNITNEDQDDVAPLETFRINLQKSPLVSSALPDMVEPDLVLVNQVSEINNNHSSNLNEISDNGGPSSPPKQISPEEPLHSEHDDVQDSLGLQVSFELAPSSPRVKRSAEVAPSPPRVKRRRIKYDQATVLTNEFMKNSIEDAGGLKRKRKGVSSFLDVYRLNNAQKKQEVLFDPVITGLSDNLSQMFEAGYVTSKAHLINTEQANPDAMEVDHFVDAADRGDNAIPISSPDKAHLINTEETNPDSVEVGRFSETAERIDNILPISSPDNTIFSSPRPADENTPAFSTGMGSKSYQAQTTIGTSVGPTSNPASSIGSFMSDTETPFSQSHHGFNNNSGGLFKIPEEEFAFMEDDGGTPSLRGTPDAGSLLPRTRGVAKLIKEKSAATPSTSENFGSVSMKSILVGKTKTICSRMFFETLVLKSCDLIDVKQDEPYGDITLKVTSKLSKLDFSN